jgi:site-specific DNA recombinase
MKLVGYIRVSTNSQAENTSLPEQREKIEAYCNAFGHQLVEIFEEVQSGKDSAGRPIFAQALQSVKSKADGIVAVKLDRIARNTRDVLALVEDVLKPDNKSLVLLDIQVDTSTPIGKMILTVMAAVASLERDTIIERTQGGRKAKASSGGYAYGSPHFGKRSVGTELVAHDDELETIEIIRRHRRSGKSYQSIARYLNEHGIKSKRGGRWHPETVSAVCKRFKTKPNLILAENYN